MNSLDFYLALLFGCKRDVARIAGKVGGLTDCVFTGLCGALPKAKGKGGGVQGAYCKACSGIGKVAIFLVAAAMFILTFTSCGGTMRIFKTWDFSVIDDTNPLEGYYINKSEMVINPNPYPYTGEYLKYHDGYLLRCFNIRDTSDIVYVTIKSQNEIKLIYCIDTTRHEHLFEGRMKRKYFEIYFKKSQFIIPIILSDIDNNRIRIGKAKNGDLIVRWYIESRLSFLFFSVGHAFEDAYIFPQITTDFDNAPQNCLCQETEHYPPPD